MPVLSATLRIARAELMFLRALRSRMEASAVARVARLSAAIMLRSSLMSSMEASTRRALCCRSWTCWISVAARLAAQRWGLIPSRTWPGARHSSGSCISQKCRLVGTSWP